MARKQQSVAAKRYTGTNVYEAALERARHIYDIHDTVSIAFSGGKDSTATLQVMLEVAHERDRLPLHVVFLDEEAIPYETEDYVRRTAARDDIDLQWYCLPLKENNACSVTEPNWYPWAPEDEDKWVREMPPEAITQDDIDWYPKEKERRLAHVDGIDLLMWGPEHGMVANCLGIRAAESLMRYRAVNRRAHNEDNYIVNSVSKRIKTVGGNVFKCYPIYDWSTADVWTAPNKFGWDYNEAYDIMEMAGLNAASQRCSPPFGTEPLQKLHVYKTCFPDIWDRMLDRVPGVNAAVRYAKTELYAYKALPPKPSNMKWIDFAKGYLERQAPDWQKKTRGQIRQYIVAHHRATSDPIMPFAPHPMTGMTWRDMVMLAMRGDPRNRKQPGMKAATDRDQYARMKEAYDAELEKQKEDGTLWECLLT